MKKYNVISLFLLVCLLGFGQKTETISSKELFSAYQDMSKLDVSLRVNAFIIENGQREQVTSYKMTYRTDREQRGLWYQMGTETVLRNANWGIQINEKEKTITCYKRDPKKATKQVISEEDKIGLTENMKQYIQNEDVMFVLTKQEGNLKAYETTNLPYPIKKGIFWVNEQKHIVKTSYNYHPNEYGQQNFVEVTYEVFNPNPVFDKHSFSEKKYISMKGGEAKLNQEWSGYTLFNANTYSIEE